MLNKLVHVVAICSEKIIKLITHFDFPMKIEDLDHGLASKKFLLAATWHNYKTTKNQNGNLILGISGAENINIPEIGGLDAVFQLKEIFKKTKLLSIFSIHQKLITSSKLGREFLY